MASFEQTLAETSDQAMADAFDQEAPHQSDGDPFCAFSDNLLGAVLLRVACNGVKFGGQDSPMSDEDEADTETKIDKALIELLPSESAWLAGNPEAPGEATSARSSSVKCSSSLISFRHALVCKRWLRVARFVLPAIVVPLDRFFSARALASLLRAPAIAGFPNLRHLHLAPNALDTVDSALVRAICAGSGPSLTHLSLQLHDTWLHVTRARQYPPPGIGTQAAEAALAARAISSADVATLFWSCTQLELRIVACTLLDALPHSVSAMCSLARLTLEGCAARALPEDVGQLSNLVRLKLSCERLTALPRSFGQLGKLQKLRLHAYYGLVQLPECLANLSSLETLAIYGGTSLVSLPPNFEQLPQLRRLELFKCAIQRLPERFGQLLKLEFFKVGSTDSFTRKDSEPGQPAWPPPTALTVSAQEESASMFMLMDEPLLLDQLDESLLGRCLLHSFPMSFTQLTSLQQLVIDGCDALEGLPDGLGDMAGLQVLQVKNCPQLRCFMSLLPFPPPTSTSARPAPPLPMLHSLVISNCPSLTSLPRGLDALPRLKRVTLDKCSKLGFANQLSVYHRPSSTPHAAPIALPPSVTTVSLLDVFPVARYLPDSFLTLSRLTHLNLHHFNSLQALFAPRPHSAQAATVLGEMDLGSEAGQVYCFPVDPQPGQPGRLALLSSLQHLAIVNTRLPLLPSNHSDLQSLKVLILEGCIRMPSLPDSLPHLSNLEKLVLSTLPRLARLPKNLGQLKALKELTVEACDALTGLPASIGLFSSLVLLSVIECEKFSSVPDSIGSLPRLASLKLNGLFRLRRLPESISRLPAL
ncbi:unnamed protein product [Closterium sp. NIES-65]|nr:unnamed protein product [Closterium sp. NIES-65]